MVKKGFSIMIRKVMLVMVLWVSADVAQAQAYLIKKRMGDYETEIRMDRFPPLVGNNPIAVEILDSAHHPVTDAKVLVNYYMPPMPRMAPMNYTTNAELDGMTYEATMKLIMSGPWTIAIKISLDRKRFTIKFNVDAQ
jgi:hypothetical protein